MKTIRLFLAVFLLSVPLIQTMGQSITLVNRSQGHVYVGAMPMGETEYRNLLNNPSQLKQFIVQEFLSFRSLAPGALLQNFPTFSQNDTLIYGMVMYPGREGAPVFQFRIPPNTDNESYAITQENFVPGSDSQGFLSLSTFEIPRDENPLVIDRRFVDWLHIPDLRKFPLSFVPSQILQRTSENAVFINPEQSAFWQKGGVQLERFKAAITTDRIFFMLSSFQTISPGTRYILRYYPQEDLPNTGSLEISVQGMGGPLFLWLPGSRTPIIHGQFAASHFSLEAEFPLEILSRYLDFDPENGSALWELSSAAAEAGVYEEFYYGFVPQREIFPIGR